MPAEAVIRALRHVWLTLEPLKVPMAVMGGLALATWKHVRATRDVDLLVAIEKSDLPEILRKLRAADVHPKCDPPVVTLGELDLIQLLYEPPESYMDLQIDLLLAKSEYHREALRRRVVTRLPDLDIRIAVLSCEDMILHKLLAGRIIDRVDVATLLRVNRPSLQLDYIVEWIGCLGLAAPWVEAWHDAFPDEPPPGATAGFSSSEK
jgi:hypothetical protein